MAEEMSSKEITPDDEDYQELILSPKYNNVLEQTCQEQLQKIPTQHRSRNQFNQTITSRPQLIARTKTRIPNLYRETYHNLHSKLDTNGTKPQIPDHP